MADPRGIQPLKAFVDSIESAKHAHYAARAESNVAHEDAFADMRAHILKLYDKTESPHSFLDGSGAIFDCIPIEQQPALKGSAESVPAAPDLPQRDMAGGPQDADERRDSLIPSPFGPDRTDWHGNTMACPPGTIPMRRVTLENLTRFANLRDFFRKGPRGAGRPPRASEPATVPATHRWAHAYQVTNITRTRNTRAARWRRTPPRSTTAAKWWALPVFRPWAAARLPTPAGRKRPFSAPSPTGLPWAGRWSTPA